MFITLTNASPAHKGKPVSINTNCVVTINADKVERQLDETTTTFENVTFIFCPPHGTWEVQESLTEVVDKFNGKHRWLK